MKTRSNRSSGKPSTWSQKETKTSVISSKVECKLCGMSVLLSSELVQVSVEVNTRVDNLLWSSIAGNCKGKLRGLFQCPSVVTVSQRLFIIHEWGADQVSFYSDCSRTSSLWTVSVIWSCVTCIQSGQVPGVMFPCPLCFRLIGGSDYKLIYRHYATLYFVFCVDSSESELGILDLIQVKKPGNTLCICCSIAVLSLFLFFLNNIFHPSSGICGNPGQMLWECLWARLNFPCRQGRNNNLIICLPLCDVTYLLYWLMV